MHGNASLSSLGTFLCLSGSQGSSLASGSALLLTLMYCSKQVWASLPKNLAFQSSSTAEPATAPVGLSSLFTLTMVTNPSKKSCRSSAAGLSTTTLL